MISIKSKGHPADETSADEAEGLDMAKAAAPEGTHDVDGGETPEADELVIDDEPDEDMFAADEPQSEAYLDYMERVMEEKGYEPAPSQPEARMETSAVYDPGSAAGPQPETSKLSYMLRCGSIAAHVLVTAALFALSFNGSSSYGVSDTVSLSLQTSATLSYLASYALATAMLGLPAVLLAASLPGRVTTSSRYALAASAADALVAATAVAVAFAFGYVPAACLATAFAGLAAAAAVSVAKA